MFNISKKKMLEEQRKIKETILPPTDDLSRKNLVSRATMMINNRCKIKDNNDIFNQRELILLLDELYGFFSLHDKLYFYEDTVVGLIFDYINKNSDIEIDGLLNHLKNRLIYDHYFDGYLSIYFSEKVMKISYIIHQQRINPEEYTTYINSK